MVSNLATWGTHGGLISKARYQNDTDVVVSVFIKNVKGADLHTEIHERSVSLQCNPFNIFNIFTFQLSLNVKLPTGSEIVFDLDPLSHPVVPDQSSAKVLTTKIEVRLIKATAGIKWNMLEGEDTSSSTMRMFHSFTQSDPGVC